MPLRVTEPTPALTLALGRPAATTHPAIVFVIAATAKIALISSLATKLAIATVIVVDESAIGVAIALYVASAAIFASTSSIVIAVIRSIVALAVTSILIAALLVVAREAALFIARTILSTPEVPAALIVTPIAPALIPIVTVSSWHIHLLSDCSNDSLS
jgi:hypothetical protein